MKNETAKVRTGAMGDIIGYAMRQSYENGFESGKTRAMRIIGELRQSIGLSMEGYIKLTDAIDNEPHGLVDE